MENDKKKGGYLEFFFFFFLASLCSRIFFKEKQNPEMMFENPSVLFASSKVRTMNIW